MAFAFEEDILSVPLPPDNEGSPAIAFRSFEDIIDWINAEQAYWKTLFGVSSGATDAVRSLWAPIEAQFDKARRESQNVVSVLSQSEQARTPDSAPVEKAQSRILSYLPDFRSEAALLSTSPKAKYLESLKDYELRIATFAAFSGQRYPNEVLAIQGYLEAYRYRHGPEESTEHHVKALEDIANKYTQTLSNRNADFREVVRDLNSSIEQFSDEHQRRLEKTSEDLEELRTQFESEIATREAVKYWSSKRKDHDEVAKKYAFAVAGWFLLGALGAVVLIRSLLAPLSPESSIVTMLAQFPSLQAPLFALGGLLILLYIWVARLLVRFLLANSHLATDAGERKMATQVFLALAADASVTLGEKERQMVFERLVMPASLGMIKEDSAPPSLFGIASKRLEK